VTKSAEASHEVPSTRACEIQGTKRAPFETRSVRGGDIPHIQRVRGNRWTAAQHRDASLVANSAQFPHEGTDPQRKIQLVALGTRHPPQPHRFSLKRRHANSPIYNKILYIYIHHIHVCTYILYTSILYAYMYDIILIYIYYIYYNNILPY